MRRSVGALLTILSCAACSSESAPRAAPRAPSTAPRPLLSTQPELLRLAPFARAGGAGEPVRILAPANGAEVAPDAAESLVISVSGPARAPDRRVMLALSLDGRRPRPVTPGALRAVELLDGSSTLGAGVHDLVLAAVGPDGVALEASRGIASSRFFVGPRPPAPPPARLVCLAPFGTFYGKEARIALDFVVVSGSSNAVDIAIRGPSGARRVRAEGSGPFALGAFPPGDHELSLTSAEGGAALPGRCGFTLNPELERAP